MVQKSIQDGMPEDFYTIDLMQAYTQLGYILGEEVERRFGEFEYLKNFVWENKKVIKDI